MSRKIIPGQTTCCAPPAPHCVCTETHLQIDGDCVSAGDILVCPEHHDQVIWTFLKGWWEALGGTFEDYPEWRTAQCGVCYKSWSIDAWSYGG